MISIEQWRAGVGLFNGRITCGSKNLEIKATYRATKKEIFLFIMFLLTFTTLDMMLIIGGVEQNPGPLHRANVVMCTSGQFLEINFFEIQLVL